MSNDIYPLTIVKDRYNGSYSGGKFTAWNLESWSIPEAISWDDVSCMDFWYKEIAEAGVPFGLGNSPDEAIEDLKIEIEKANTNEELKEKLLKVSCSEMEWDAIYNFMTDGGKNDNLH